MFSEIVDDVFACLLRELHELCEFCEQLLVALNSNNHEIFVSVFVKPAAQGKMYCNNVKHEI